MNNASVTVGSAGSSQVGGELRSRKAKEHFQRGLQIRAWSSWLPAIFRDFGNHLAAKAKDFWAVKSPSVHRLDIDNLPPDWSALVQRVAYGQWSDSLHRGIDVLVSSVLLLLTAPLLVIVAAAIKIDSTGPVFYSQLRVGLHGRVFNIRKFRSMSLTAEAPGQAIWAAKNDARVTRVGRIIRQTRIDELPQLLNVLSGDMSVIGPRPERPQFVEQLSNLIPAYADRACLKPGITGWAQVKYPYGSSVEDARMKLAYDLYYVSNRSVVFHIRIMAMTVRVVLLQEGAR